MHVYLSCCYGHCLLHLFGWLQTKDLAKIAMHLARLPKENGKRGRMVVFTHGAKPTVVIQGDSNC